MLTRTHDTLTLTLTHSIYAGTALTENLPTRIKGASVHLVVCAIQATRTWRNKLMDHNCLAAVKTMKVYAGSALMAGSKRTLESMTRHVWHAPQGPNKTLLEPAVYIVMLMLILVSVLVFVMSVLVLMSVFVSVSVGANV